MRMSRSPTGTQDPSFGDEHWVNLYPLITRLWIAYVRRSNKFLLLIAGRCLSGGFLSQTIYFNLKVSELARV